jgi:hypothetical protein
MRAARWLGGMAWVFAAALPGQAQTSPNVRVITAGEVLVRSGPSDKFYPTMKLHQGDKVEVVVPQRAEGQQPGWVAIKPPRGSYSWINQRFVEIMVPGTGKVVADAPVPVLVGSSETNERPTRESAKAARGSQVIILDKPNYTDSGVWLPIVPQPGEVRYIPEGAVFAGGGAQGVAANYGHPPAPQASPPGTPVVAPVSTREDPREEQRRYLQKAAEVEHDPARRQQILQLLANLPASPGAAQTPGHPANAATPATTGGPAAAPGGTGQANPGNTSLYANQAPAGPPAAARWSEYGELRRTAFREPDGRQVYALVDSRGRSLLYATPLPNFSLESYVGQQLALYGPITYHRDDPCLRADIMTVSHVAPLPRQPQY